MPSALEIAARAWRQRLLAYEQAPMQHLRTVYEASWQRLQQEIDRYSQRIEQGDPLLPGLMHRRQAARDAQQAIAVEIDRLNRLAAMQTTAMQQHAVGGAHQSVQEMVAAQDTQVATFLRRPNFQAVESLIGFASDGSPLLDVFNRRSNGQAAAMTNLLAQNVALGISPIVTARQMRDQFGTVFAHAKTIARTETVRAYRESSHLSMEANDDVLDGWTWICRLSARSCVACFAMHGTFHPLSERLQDHPNGTCTAAPHVRGAPRPAPNGGERFAQLTLDQQQAALGKAKYAAWQDGAFDFRDLAATHRDRRWGNSIRERSLSSLVGEDRARGYTETARLLARGEWKPNRDDATLIGAVGDAAWSEIRRHSTVRQVYAIPETWDHIGGRRIGQIDIGTAQEMLPSILNDPAMVIRAGRDDSSLLLVGRWDEQYALVVAVKPVRNELWLATMYKTSQKRLDRLVRQGNVVFRRKE